MLCAAPDHPPLQLAVHNPTWHVSHCSRMALSLVNRVTQGAISAAKGLANGDALMALLLMMWSSSRVWASSSGPPLRMYVPVAFHSASSKLSSCQSVRIFSRAFSMDHSLLACSLISSMACRQTPQLVQPPQLWEDQPQGWPQGLQPWGDAHHGCVDSAGNLAKVHSNGRQLVAVPVAAQPPCGLMWIQTGAWHSCRQSLQLSTSLLHSLPRWCRQKLAAFGAGELAPTVVSKTYPTG